MIWTDTPTLYPGGAQYLQPITPLWSYSAVKGADPIPPTATTLGVVTVDMPTFGTSDPPITFGDSGMGG